MHFLTSLLNSARRPLFAPFKVCVIARSRGMCVCGKEEWGRGGTERKERRKGGREVGDGRDCK